MTIHKYRVGQMVEHHPSEGDDLATPKPYKILRLLADDSGARLYRIKSITDIDPRIVEERDLAAFLAC